MKEPFLKARKIIEKINASGYEAYFVGGSIRDYILHREIKDVDIATSAPPDVILSMFPKTIDVGVAHGTVVVLFDKEQYEVTTFRTEGTYLDSRRPSDVQFIDSLYEDLQRRDFTMNAIAMNIEGEIIDPFNGIDAIQSRVISTVGDPAHRFSEDALRMMRAIRFVSQLSFSLSVETKNAIVENKKLLENISIERITIEFEKLLSGRNSHEALRLIIDTDVYQYLPGLRSKAKQLSTLLHYQWSELSNRTEYWGLLCYLLEVETIESFLRVWKLPIKVIKNVQQLISCIHHVNEKGWNKHLYYSFGLECIIEAERVRNTLGYLPITYHLDELNMQYHQLPIKSRKDLVVNGNDLATWCQKKPGKWISEMLEKIEYEVIEGNVENNKQVIKEWLESCNQK